MEEKLSNQTCNQKHFHEHYLKSDHTEICNWDITNMGNSQTRKFLRQKELYWYNKLKTYVTFGLHERDVYAACYTRRSLHSLDVTSIIIFCYCLLVFFFVVIVTVIVNIYYLHKLCY